MNRVLANLSLKLKLLFRSRYILAARHVVRKIGLKHVKMLVYERSLDTGVPVVKTKVPVEVRTVSINDMRDGLDQRIIRDGLYQRIIRVVHHRHYYTQHRERHREILRRLEAGDVCLIAMVEDVVAGFCWLYFRDRKYEPDIERVETFRDDEALVYSIAVFPEFRKNGIGSKLNEGGLRYLKSEGYKKVYAYVETDNIPSLKSFEAVGLYPTKIITCLRIFNFKRIKERPINTRYSQTQMSA